MTLTAEIAAEVNRAREVEAERERRIQLHMERERAKREAARRLAAEDRGAVVPPACDTLRARLARPRTSTPWRIRDWQPQGGRVMLAAQFKAGKTTLVGNLIRSLVDLDLFLGCYEVTPITGTVVVLDFEMSESQLDEWLRAQEIQNDDRVIVIPMRGRAAAFNILDAAIRAEWANRFRALHCTYPIVDCVRPIMDALGLDEHRDAGRLLVAFDALLAEAGITEAALVQHMGHTGERSRGDSRLRDWPDVEWRLMRQDEEPSSARFITAYGRDVDVPESQLEFDQVTRRLTVAGGSRRDAKSADALSDVLAVLSESAAPMTGRAIKRALSDSDHSRDVLDAALRYGTKTGELVPTNGPRNSKLYIPGSSVRVSGSVRAVSGVNSEQAQFQCPSVRGLIEARTVGRSLTEDDTDDRI
jgi:hypothetical protein